jgi:hypothetical protein
MAGRQGWQWDHGGVYFEALQLQNQLSTKRAVRSAALSSDDLKRSAPVFADPHYDWDVGLASRRIVASLASNGPQPFVTRHIPRVV